MRNRAISRGTFKAILDSVISADAIEAVLDRCGTKRRCLPAIDAADFIAGLVFHLVAGPGTCQKPSHKWLNGDMHSSQVTRGHLMNA